MCNELFPDDPTKLQGYFNEIDKENFEEAAKLANELSKRKEEKK
jgi:hypothetical protein